MSKLHQWMTKKGPRYLIDKLHQDDLESKAANYEFIDQLTQSDAEDKAYGEYRHSQHKSAAKKHYRSMMAANASGDSEAAKKHSLLYHMHTKAAGGDPEVAPEWKDEPGGEDHVVKFKSHPADSYLLDKAEDGLLYGEKLMKGDVIQFPQNRVSPPQPGEPAKVLTFPAHQNRLEDALLNHHPDVVRIYQAYHGMSPRGLMAISSALENGQMNNPEHAPGVKFSHIIDHILETKNQGLKKARVSSQYWDTHEDVLPGEQYDLLTPPIPACKTCGGKMIADDNAEARWGRYARCEKCGQGMRIHIPIADHIEQRKDKVEEEKQKISRGIKVQSVKKTELKDLPIWAQVKMLSIAVENLAKADDDIKPTSVKQMEEYQKHYQKLRAAGMSHRFAHKAAKSIAYAGLPYLERPKSVQTWAKERGEMQPNGQIVKPPAPIVNDQAIPSQEDVGGDPLTNEEWFDEHGNWIKDADLPATTADEKMKAAGVSYKTKSGKWMPNRPSIQGMKYSTVPKKAPLPVVEEDTSPWDSDPEPWDLNNIDDLRSLYGDRIHEGFDPTNAKHWGGLVSKLNPRERVHMGNNLFSHDRWVSRVAPGVPPATGVNIRNGSHTEQLNAPAPEAEPAMSDSDWDRADSAMNTARGSIGINAPFKDITTKKGELDPEYSKSEKLHRVFKCMSKDAREATKEMLKMDFAKYVVKSAMDEQMEVQKSEKLAGLKTLVKSAIAETLFKTTNEKREKRDQARDAATPISQKETPSYAPPMEKGMLGAMSNAGVKPSQAGGAKLATQPGGIPSIPKPPKMAMSALDPNKIKTRDEGIRRSKLPPGAPGADKAGVGVTIDRKKEANRKAARKWKPGKE